MSFSRLSARHQPKPSPSAPRRTQGMQRGAILARQAVLAGATVLMGIAWSCSALPHSETVFRDRTDVIGPNRLTDVGPTDVLVAPVRNQTDLEDLPLAAMRSALHDALVERLFSPLNLEYTDSHWVESTFTGDRPPEAILVVSITHWSTSGLSGQGNLEVGADVRMFGGGSTAGEVLFSAHVDRVLQVVKGGNPPFGPKQKLIERAARMWAPMVLAILPERNPLASLPKSPPGLSSTTASKFDDQK